MNEAFKPDIVEPPAPSGEATVGAERLSHALHAQTRPEKQTAKRLPDNLVENDGYRREGGRYG